MDPATICEEDYKLATVCLIKHSGLRDSVQNKIVHFKSVFQLFLFICLFVFFFKTVYFVLYFMSFHLLDEFQFKGRKKKTCLWEKR